MDRTTEITEPTEITETQICYGPSNNSSKPIKNNINNKQSNQHQVKILKREPAVNQNKENDSDMKSMFVCLALTSRNHFKLR